MFNTMPWYRKYATRINLIESADGGEGGSDNPDPNNDPEPTDWQAKYEETLKHSREWEKRAKDNKKDADELKQFKESQLSEQEKAIQHTKELEARIAAFESEQQANQWKAQVSKETGVPADLLRGDSLEDMQAFAKNLADYAHPEKKRGPRNQGGTPSHKPEDQAQREAIRQLFAEI
jgi:hypothetical protein